MVGSRLGACLAGRLVRFALGARRALADRLPALLLASVAGWALARLVLLRRRAGLVLLPLFLLPPREPPLLLLLLLLELLGVLLLIFFMEQQMPRVAVCLDYALIIKEQLYLT